MEHDTLPFVALSFFIQALAKQPSLDRAKLATDIEAMLTPPINEELDKFMRKMARAVRTAT